MTPNYRKGLLQHPAGENPSKIAKITPKIEGDPDYG
jgi:hypothetical protein